MRNPDITLPSKMQPDFAISTVWDYVNLLKPRVMSLVVLTAFIGAFMAPGHMHPYLFGVSILSIAIGAGASGAFNMWYDRDIDRIMRRTQKRPLPQNMIEPGDALILASFLSLGAIMTLYFSSNMLAAGLLAFTIFFYAVIYTMWLKRWTSQNIVIGGAAGAFPPMIGWAAVTGNVSWESVIMFMIIFLWTPPHFWALALFKSEEYEKANIPMMPNVAGLKSTLNQIFIYSLLLAFSTFLPYAIGMSGPLYLSLAVVLSMRFVLIAWQLKRQENLLIARKLFGFSILYLFAIFSGLLLDKLIGY